MKKKFMFHHKAHKTSHKREAGEQSLLAILIVLCSNVGFKQTFDPTVANCKCTKVALFWIVCTRQI